MDYIAQTALAVIEPVPIQDVFVNRLALVEGMGAFYRVTLSCDRALESIVSVRLIIPTAEFQAMNFAVHRMLNGNPLSLVN